MTKKQHYMTEKERYKLESYLEAGKGVSWIARTMGFCRQTIYNEIERGAYIHTCDYWDEIRYSADKAQQLHDRNQTAKGRPIKLGNHHDFANFVEDKMLGVQEDGSIDKRKRFSPAAALAEARRAGYTFTICVSTLYSYIEKLVFLRITNKNLWVKGKKRKPGEKPERRVAHPKLPSIEIRPKEIGERSVSGHWEMDLVVGKAKTKPALLTLVERSSRETMIFKLPDKKASSVQKVFDQLERSTPDFKSRFRSITTDNGSEFLRYQELRASIHGGDRFEIYYCHSYSAWEKGSNENINRMIRRWYPKGTDFTWVSKKEIAVLQNWLNCYPRKILNWKCPQDLAM
ncbi:MAG: IS30 family transposase [Oscillospiraceae bacterium]|nr:IS30 family transposase [Oscillospiraceae bacterium]